MSPLNLPPETFSVQTLIRLGLIVLVTLLMLRLASVLLLTQTSTRGGSRESAEKALAVMP